MIYLKALFLQDFSNQQPAMTAGRIFFAAHERDDEPVHAFLQTPKATLESFRDGDPVIQNMFFRIVELISSRPAAKFASQRNIANACLLERFLNRIEIKLGKIF